MTEPIINDGTDDAWQAIADALGNLGYVLNSHEDTAAWVQQYLFAPEPRLLTGVELDALLGEPQGEPSDAAARALAIHDTWGTPHDPEGKIRPLSDYTNLSASMARELRKGVDDV